MSLPALRRPKLFNNGAKNPKKRIKDINYVILTLKDDKKLVVSSDSYNGIITKEDKYECVLCGLKMEINENNKQQHIQSKKHGKIMARYPHLEEFSENLLRKLNNDGYYCTVCNVIVLNPFLKRHVTTDVHMEELEKAVTRASVYKPSLTN